MKQIQSSICRPWLILNYVRLIPQEYIQELSGHFSDYTDPDIQSKIEFCKEHMYFIWGSWEKGGLYCRKYTANTIIFGVNSGLCQCTEGPLDGDYFFALHEDTYNDITASECKQVAIGFSEYNIATDYPEFFYIQYKSDNNTIATYYIDTNSLLSATYNNISENATLSDALSDYMWTDDANYPGIFHLLNLMQNLYRYGMVKGLHMLTLHHLPDL